MTWLVLAALTWADWVGSYHGALHWKGCTAAGVSKATLELDAVDGVLSIDLAPAGNALHALTLVDEGDRLEAQDADVTVVVRPDAIAVRYDSGCTMTAALARVPKTPAGWARIAARCAKQPHVVATQRALVDAGCAPNPDVALVRGSVCQQLGDLGARLARCGRVPPREARTLAAAVAQLVGAAQTVDAASAPALDAQCTAVLGEARRIGRAARCL